jgi:protein-S-isoprenylcysteine O-methyltransferase Ste14
MLFCLLGMLVLHWILPIRWISNWALLIGGFGLIALGLMIAFGAEGQFRRRGTTVDHLGITTKLVTDGWFKYSRNPMYLSLVLILIGAWIMLGSISPVLGVITYLFVTNKGYITQEEKRLAATFGREYESYRMRTRRWL